MVGEDLSSTDLHLANGDSLLVGQVAELAQMDRSDASVASRLHTRKLQVIILHRMLGLLAVYNALVAITKLFHTGPG